MEEEKVPMEEKKDPREKQIEELDGLAGKSKADAEAFKTEGIRLEASLANEDKMIAERIAKIQNVVPDKSSQGLIDDVLKLPVGKSEQLQSNIKKLAIARKNAERQAVLYEAAKNKILSEIEEERRDKLAREAFAELMKTVELVQAAENQFYSTTIFSIERAYKADPKFCDINSRAGRLGLEPVLAHVISSHIKEGDTQNVSLDSVIEAVRDIRDFHGKGTMLLEKVYKNSFREHPMEDSSYFGIQQSDKPPLRDPENY